MKPKILGVIGSIRKNSVTRRSVQYFLQKAQAQGAEVQTLDLLETPLPLFNPDQRNHSSHIQVREQVVWANSFLLGSPDYHGSMSGVMKNFLDYFWKEFSGKLFSYICASHEKGLTTMDQMRTAIRQCYGWSLPYGISIVEEDFDLTTGEPKNSKTQHRLNLMVHDLCTYSSLLNRQFQEDLKSDNPDAGFATHYR